MRRIVCDRKLHLFFVLFRRTQVIITFFVELLKFKGTLICYSFLWEFDQLSLWIVISVITITLFY
jgi:hypothetical protein